MISDIKQKGVEHWLNLKSFLERHFLRDFNNSFQLTVSIKDLFSTNQENGTEMRFVAGATKINLKNLKT